MGDEIKAFKFLVDRLVRTTKHKYILGSFICVLLKSNENTLWNSKERLFSSAITLGFYQLHFAGYYLL